MLVGGSDGTKQRWATGKASAQQVGGNTGTSPGISIFTEADKAHALRDVRGEHSHLFARRE